jgi:hypothetical protein
LVYPGANSGIRFEKLREGIVDYEKIRILREMVSVTIDKKSRALMRRLDDHLKTLTTEHDFKENKLKAEIYKGEKLINDLSAQLGKKPRKFKL